MRMPILFLVIALPGIVNINGINPISLAHAQSSKTKESSKSTSARKKIIITQNDKQVGFKDSLPSKSRRGSGLAPALIDRDDDNEFISDSAGNPDYRIQRGCIRRSLNESSLPANIGYENAELSEFFKNQTKGFFSKMRGNCIPYALALGKRNRFESLSIMNGPVHDEKSEILTFTPSSVGNFLVQQDNLKDEFQRYSEIEMPLRDVLYDQKKLGDKLPVELIWELNSLIKQIYPEENNSLENTNSVVRIIVDFGDRERWAQIWAVEIVDPNSKDVFASAFWVDRGDIPGGFYTANGDAIERSFWTNPLSYRRISRGVGNVPVTKKRAPSKTNAASATAPTPTTQRYRAHMGIDYAAPIGTPVFSVANGKVVHLGFSGAFGNLIILEHPGNYRTYYAHLSSYNVDLELGNEVRRGFEIGYVGTTGRSTGPHLHFELRKDGVYVDPYNPSMQLDLWSMRDSESGQLTKALLLLGSITNE